MGPEDSNDLGQLYLTTQDGHKVPITATALCIPDLISADLSEEGDKLDDRAFRLRSPYTASFTIEPTDETVKKLYRFFRATRRWSRKKAQQKKRKLAKEKKHGLLHKET